VLSLPYRALHQHHPLSNCNSIRDTRDEMLAERNQYEHGDRCLLSVKERRRAMTDEEDALFGIDKPNVARSEIPAVTHVDYSARLQTVHREINPRYHALLSVFKAKTGCPVRSRSQRRGLRCGGTDGLHDSPPEGRVSSETTHSSPTWLSKRKRRCMTGCRLSGCRSRVPRSSLTLRWRGMDSNFRFRAPCQGGLRR